ncbi:hypothetical protein GGR50DRAFT_696514 [Xylaria sp. CBS 124048]|nr:hypothetical protein GGR50DRAFT_696514 [Xylaria sp. CBS 124048]
MSPSTSPSTPSIQMRSILSVALLGQLGASAAEPNFSIPHLLPSPTGALGPVVSLLGNVGNFEPPPLIYTPNPSPECAKSHGGNGGELQCCRAIVAGDQPIVEFLAQIYGYVLNPNDVNGLVFVDLRGGLRWIDKPMMRNHRIATDTLMAAPACGYAAKSPRLAPSYPCIAQTIILIND